MVLPNGSPKPVLLMAEDEEITATILKSVLGRHGYEVIHAENGRRMQTLVDQIPPPAIVLLDMMLPFLNGLQLLAHIRLKPEWKHVPVVMLTANEAEQAIQLALQSGAQDYVVKPFDPQELIIRLQGLLKRAA